ncbi:MAG: HipA N-terminal domain-containing protein, partial [Bacteroidetes bacterium]|nr:HipA N-terminal domain-containing protein [Bacteroidota bacterium]
MENIEQLTVFISLDGKHIEVGELVTDNKKIYFKYYPSFIKTGLQISPFKMKLSDQILSAETTIFDGLFGVFSDSLPDGWGRLLLDRTLLSKGIAVNQITALDRLAYVGSGGMGALIYKPEISSEFQIKTQLELDVIATEMNPVLDGTPTDVIEEFYSLGGTSGGARP